MTGRGIFIAFEGIDGSGKTTQLDRFAAWLAELGIDLLGVREPGGTELGERIREMLLDHATGDIAPAAEALLYAASRAELVAQVIRPALDAGRIVVADRFIGSSLAYQGAGRGLGVEGVRAANDLALSAASGVGATGPVLLPDRVVLVRVDAATAAGRLASVGAGDRIERAGEAFFARVAAAYDQLAAEDPNRHLVVDGTLDADTVHAEIRRRLHGMLVAARPGVAMEAPA